LENEELLKKLILNTDEMIRKLDDIYTILYHFNEDFNERHDRRRNLPGGSYC